MRIAAKPQTPPSTPPKITSDRLVPLFPDTGSVVGEEVGMELAVRVGVDENVV